MHGIIPLYICPACPALTAVRFAGCQDGQPELTCAAGHRWRAHSTRVLAWLACGRRIAETFRG